MAKRAHHLPLLASLLSVLLCVIKSPALTPCPGLMFILTHHSCSSSSPRVLRDSSRSVQPPKNTRLSPDWSLCLQSCPLQSHRHPGRANFPGLIPPSRPLWVLTALRKKPRDQNALGHVRVLRDLPLPSCHLAVLLPCPHLCALCLVCTRTVWFSTTCSASPLLPLYSSEGGLLLDAPPLQPPAARRSLSQPSGKPSHAPVAQTSSEQSSPSYWLVTLATQPAFSGRLASTLPKRLALSWVAAVVVGTEGLQDHPEYLRCWR